MYSCFLNFFLHSPSEYKWFSKRSILPIDGTLIGTTTSGQSEFGGNGNEDVLHTPYISRTGALLPDAV